MLGTLRASSSYYATRAPLYREAAGYVVYMRFSRQHHHHHQLYENDEKGGNINESTLRLRTCPLTNFFCCCHIQSTVHSKISIHGRRNHIMGDIIDKGFKQQQHTGIKRKKDRNKDSSSAQHILTFTLSLSCFWVTDVRARGFALLPSFSLMSV